jgi:hypothetical protein
MTSIIEYVYNSEGFECAFDAIQASYSPADEDKHHFSKCLEILESHGIIYVERDEDGNIFALSAGFQN